MAGIANAFEPPPLPCPGQDRFLPQESFHLFPGTIQVSEILRYLETLPGFDADKFRESQSEFPFDGQPELEGTGGRYLMQAMDSAVVQNLGVVHAKDAFITLICISYFPLRLLSWGKISYGVAKLHGIGLLQILRILRGRTRRSSLASAVAARSAMKIPSI
jgi:hypothetical protein